MSHTHIYNLQPKKKKKEIEKKNSRCRRQKRKKHIEGEHAQWDSNPQSPDQKSDPLSFRPWALVDVSLTILINNYFPKWKLD